MHVLCLLKKTCVNRETKRYPLEVQSLSGLPLSNRTVYGMIA